ncbi:MAG: M42 family metallopeptidase [Ruminococcaceae bacterium]|nr:M42 family metallopeptidase [Oscillospiraceae bacterium]
MYNEKISPELYELCNLFGPSGYEGEVADYIEDKIKNICDNYTKDRMGNLICLIRAGDENAEGRQRIMVSAHMDEVGVMITEICDDGLLRFDTVGGINVSVLEGRKLTLSSEKGKLCGLVMSKAIHHIDRKDRDKPNKIEKLYIDIGAKNAEEASTRVSIGDFGAFDSEFYLFGEDGAFVKAKAIDDRAGCANIIEVMRSIYANRPEANLDLYFCFTVREETGLSGAKVAANEIRPHIAIVLESTAIADIPTADPSKKVADVGKGGALSVADRSTIYDKELIELALASGKEENIPVQLKRYVSGGNDAGHIHKSGSGVRCLAISVPTRYLHSPACVASVEDINSVRRLLEALLYRITD